MEVIVNKDYVELKTNLLDKYNLPSEKLPVEKISFVSNGFLESYWYQRDIQFFEFRQDRAWFPGLRYRYGLFTGPDGLEYWSINERKGRYLIIELNDFTYRRILLSIRNNVEIKEKIEKIIGTYTRSPIPSTYPDQDKRIFQQHPPSNVLWYLLPIFFGIFGGVIAYFVLREDEPRKAKICLFIGIGLSGIGFGMMALLFIVIS